MRAFALTLVVVGLCCLFPMNGNAEDSTSAKETLHDWALAFRAGSVDEMVAFYEDSDDVLAIQSTGRVRKGTAGIREEYEAAFAEVIFEKATLANLTVRQSGNVAWATCELRANTVRVSDNTKWTLRVYTSFVLKLTGKTWEIVLEQSTPIAGIPRVTLRE